MGTYFSNFHIRTKEAKYIGKEIIGYYESLGMKLVDAKDVNATISLNITANGDWVSVYSDDFEYEDILNIAPIISEKSSSDVLAVSCVDSDYLFLNLINKQELIDLWLNIGRSSEVKIKRRSNINSWKTKINNFDLFKVNAKKEYIFAEEFLELSNEYFNLPYEEIILNDIDNCSFKLYFAALEEDNTPPSKLELTSYPVSPTKSNEPVLCRVNNIGRASKGLAIVFSGDYIENDDILIEEASLVVDKGDHVKYIPIKLQKTRLEKEGYIYYWKNESYKIPKVVSKDLPAKVYDRKRSIESICLRFIPKGKEEKMLNIKVTFIPLTNPIKGQCTWYVWMGHNSKKDYIKKYMTNHNKER
ncbi:MAG: hypothetical protein IJX78_05800 [Bacilli bacterium]|nr:hypothetical protein [Bacilli bacterium]